MKYFTNTWIITATLASLLFISGCGEDETEDNLSVPCQETVTAYEQIILAFDPNNFNMTQCNDLKAALLNVINTCDETSVLAEFGISQQAWDEIVNEIESYECTNCISALTTYAQAAQDLADNPQGVEECEALKDAVEAMDIACEASVISGELGISIEDWNTLVNEVIAIDCTP